MTTLQGPPRGPWTLIPLDEYGTGEELLHSQQNAMTNSNLSAECLEQVHSWVMAHCPCALEYPDFLRGFVVIVEDEVSRAVCAERQAILQWLADPSPQ